MSKYIIKQIGDLANIRRGASPRPIDDWMAKEGVPWVKISDATKYDSRFIYKTEGFIKTEGAKYSVEVIPEDLIVSNSATPALPKIMKINACIHDGWLLLNDFKDVDRDYLYYQIKFLRRSLIKQGNGSIFKNLKTDILKEFPVHLPVDKNGAVDMRKQRIIAKQLSIIEDKIEINNTINCKIDQLASLVYNYWFMQFDCPNDCNRPYKSSGGKMIYNGELKKYIPEGWQVRRIGDCIKHISTGLNPRKNFVLNEGDIKYITVKNLTKNGFLDLNGCDTISNATKTLINKRSKVREGDILFASIAPLGRCYLVQETPRDWEINESVFSIRVNENLNPEYLYMFLKSDSFIKQAEHSSTGSVFSGIRVSTLEDINVLIPSLKVLKEFADIISPLFKRKYLIELENRKLVDLRDFLLPLLMNGQVSLD